MCSLNTHIYIELEQFFNRAFFVLSLSLSLLRILREPKLSIKPAFFFLGILSSYLLPHVTFYMVSEHEG